MALIAILVCLALHRYLQFNRYEIGMHYFQNYFVWLQKKVPSINTSNAYISLCIVILPLLIAVGLLMTVICHTLGAIGYFVFSTLILWYCLDARLNTADLGLTFRRLFAMLFWFAIL